MKAHLLFRDRDPDLERKLTPRERALVQDLGLEALFFAMAQDDEFLLDVAIKTVLDSLIDVDAILYRQAILRDSLKNAETVRGLYQLCLDAIKSERQNSRFFFSRSPSSIVSRCRDVLEGFTPLLGKLRKIADAHSSDFESEGFSNLFATLKSELDDDFFRRVADHLRRFEFRNGVLISARLGRGNKGAEIALRTPWPDERWWLARLLRPKSETYSYQIHPRDDNGFRALSALRSKGLNSTANALNRSTVHILSFFRMLRAELAFYVGCLNARAALAGKGQPTCFPSPAQMGECRLSFRQLYDVSLALNSSERVVGNDLNADGKSLLVITGANQGGKTTYLHSVGQVQLMMQAGMFAPAESFRGDLRDRIFTHFKREEDASMKSGKLDEELRRMSAMVDEMTPHSLALFNESFAATNDREGSEINGQVVSALIESGVKIATVTHLHEFARKFYDADLKGAIFLRADRREDGTRTFKVREGEPLQTSFGEDLYNEIFIDGPRSLPAETETAAQETGVHP